MIDVNDTVPHYRMLEIALDRTDNDNDNNRVHSLFFSPQKKFSDENSNIFSPHCNCIWKVVDIK